MSETGQHCKYCEAPTPYVDWEWCEPCQKARILWHRLSDGHSDERRKARIIAEADKD